LKRRRAILDEAQLLPVEFLAPIFSALDQLVRAYGSTVLLSTATMPVLELPEGFRGLSDGRNIVHIVPDSGSLARRLERVRVQLPTDLNAPSTWEEIAGRLATHDQVLCIVDRRADCRTLFSLLGEDAHHLSALMCAAHRSEALRLIKEKLKNGEPVRVVSTQLIEAGVDIDFPAVYRAFSGLPSIAQAAGRCNREGRLLSLGECIIFVPPSDPPPGILRQGRDVTRGLLADERDSALLSPAHFERFFRDLYWLQGDRLDRHCILSDLLNPTRVPCFDFATASQRFRIIPDDELPVIVPYGDALDLVSDIERHGPDRLRLRRLHRFTVGVPRFQRDRLLAAGAIREVPMAPGVFVLSDPALYDPMLGLIPISDRPTEPRDLIV
jgi:CRISPR-associated endonuclease/helicase Cas3